MTPPKAVSLLVARELLEELDVLDARDRARWASMFRRASVGAQDA